ncbi:MAG TPA: hypothetical protein VGJ48_24115, partial [Pyrinomonadaceae bacterium]
AILFHAFGVKRRARAPAVPGTKVVAFWKMKFYFEVTDWKVYPTQMRARAPAVPIEKLQTRRQRCQSCEG